MHSAAAPLLMAREGCQQKIDSLISSFYVSGTHPCRPFYFLPTNFHLARYATRIISHELNFCHFFVGGGVDEIDAGRRRKCSMSKY